MADCAAQAGRLCGAVASLDSDLDHAVAVQIRDHAAHTDVPGFSYHRSRYRLLPAFDFPAVAGAIHRACGDRGAGDVADLARGAIPNSPRDVRDRRGRLLRSDNNPFRHLSGTAMGAVPGCQSHLKSGAIRCGVGIAFDLDGMDRGRSPNLIGSAQATPLAACEPRAKRPNIIMVLDESSFDISAAPGIKVPENYQGYFKSTDGRQRSFVAKSSGGPTWYTEFNVLTGLSARSFGQLKFYVTRIAAGKISRGLPQSLQRCGYRTFSLYPTYGDFLSARNFQTSAGISQFIDMAGMGVNEDMQPDKFYFDQTLQLIARERKAEQPMFVFVYLTANHFPWTTTYRPDLTPTGWTAPGNTSEVDEYIRRQAMTASDYASFIERLKTDHPDEPFLLVRFGDHQPAISQKLLEPKLPQSVLANRIMTHDPRYYKTYYAIDALNYRPDMSSALETLEGAYLPLAILDAAGIPLDPTFVEQKKIMLRCQGQFYSCKDGAEARRFNRLLIDAGFIKNL